MAEQSTRPVGKPLELSPEQLDQAATVTLVDVAAARAIWYQDAPDKHGAVDPMRSAADPAPEQDAPDCLCLHAIKQTPGQPALHDPRCEVGRAPGTLANWSNVTAKQWQYVVMLRDMVAERDNVLFARGADEQVLRATIAEQAEIIRTLREQLHHLGLAQQTGDQPHDPR